MLPIKSKQNSLEIKRYGPPNKWDHAEYGTFCKVILDDVESDLYVQLSFDEANPRWEPVALGQKIVV